MKNLRVLAITAICAIAFVSCKKENAADKISAENIEAAATRDANADKFPVITWDKTEHDFGTINQGDVVETKFSFKNTGDKPLVIVNIKGSCGCTVPNDWPRNAILPGESGSFSVKFNSRGKRGQNNKSVTVTCNTEKGREVVKIKALVNVPEGAAAAKKPARTLNTKK